MNPFAEAGVSLARKVAQLLSVTVLHGSEQEKTLRTGCIRSPSARSPARLLRMMLHMRLRLAQGRATEDTGRRTLTASKTFARYRIPDLPQYCRQFIQVVLVEATDDIDKFGVVTVLQCSALGTAGV